MGLAELLADDASLEAIASYLDGLDHDTRWADLSSLSRKQQRALFNKAEAAPLTLDHFVPSHLDPLTPVVHYGRNTLPLLPRFKYFQKVFCRPEEGEGELYGFNESPARWWLGPGFFVAIPTEGREEWTERGPVVVDYFQVPKGKVPADWPKVVPNNRGPQMFVYNKTRDFMRKVSEHVSVGAAYKVESALDHYFVLCREDPA